jgi:hypothetical protein
MCSTPRNSKIIQGAFCKRRSVIIVQNGTNGTNGNEKVRRDKGKETNYLESEGGWPAVESSGMLGWLKVRKLMIVRISC